MARILVTGATGFIGGHVARRLVDTGHTVIATGRNAARLATMGARSRAMAADLASAPLEPLLQGCDAVVHCAALSSPWGRRKDFQSANVLATERLLAAARRERVPRFVHLASPSIYFRFRDQFGVGEEFQPPRRWITEYARSKWESECKVRAASGNDLQTLILRPRAVFGEGDNAILPRILAVAAHGRFPLVDGGRALIDVTHVDNLVDLIATCVTMELPGNGRAYNVSNGEPVRVRALLETLFAALGYPVRMTTAPRAPLLALAALSEYVARLRPGRPEPRLTRYGIGVLGYSQTLDIARARRDLHYTPRIGIQDGIVRYARWWKANGHC